MAQQNKHQNQLVHCLTYMTKTKADDQEDRRPGGGTL
jgi:hypothetical protein